MGSLEVKIDQLFDSYLNKSFFTGGVCSVHWKGEQLLQKAYGKRSSITNEHVTTDTIFDLASVTKIFTATILLKMVTEGKVTLGTTLKDCLPEVRGNKILEPISVQQLLTHSSGLTAWYPFYTHVPQADLLTILDSIELKHQENKEVVYSDLNYILLGEIIKRYFNMSLQEVIKQELITTLSLNTLTYGPLHSENVAATEFGNQIEMDMCRTRNKEFNHWRPTNQPIIGEVNDGNTYYYFKGQSGHAGLFGTANDLDQLLQLYLKGGMAKGEKLIDVALINQSLHNIAENRGLGWHSSDPFPVGFGHTGFTGTSIWIVPEKDLQVVLLTNRLHVNQPVNINPFRKELHEEILSYISGIQREDI
ncbi:serine hydrolase domain-containing protein [Bacillus carboniphilus]|uniref:Serine hydrolase domain-containing protein n=1 Tax=Bacillus carboniphilus TaxID=86663 RepID=A0ABP3GCS6_9BACI